MKFRSICRPCYASSSTHELRRVAPQLRRSFSARPHENSNPIPFFQPPFGASPGGSTPDVPYFGGNGKGKDPLGPRGPGEEEVDDREWEMRVARGMLHLQSSLPSFFEPGSTGSTMFPSDVFSRNMVLKLPAPLPLGVPGLTAYSMAFALTKSGLQALHTDLRTHLERMTFTPGMAHLPPAAVQRRQKQVRVLLGVSGKIRLAPHNVTTWKTSSLYTFSPYTGLIVSHEVESIRPLPGEGVAEWLRSRLSGWTSKDSSTEAIPCPRAVSVPRQSELAQTVERKEP